MAAGQPWTNLALLLNQEVSAVVTAMRQNSRWAMIPTRYTRAQDDDMNDDPLLEEFKILRRRLFQWQDWASVEPLTYLEPFLEVIRSPETSGPITGVALTSVRRLLQDYTFGKAKVGLREAMRASADAITQCKFEATDPAADEVVLYNILQVLLTCIQCPGGELLTHENVLSIFQACFRIGHYQTERSKDMSVLLTQASRQDMLEMVGITVARLQQAPMQRRHSGPAAPKLLQSPQQDAAARDAHSAQGGQPAAQNGSTITAPSADEEETETEVGLQTFVDLLEFIASLILSEGEGSHLGMDIFGLSLLQAALNTGAQALARHEALLLLLRQDIWGALAMAACRPNLAALSHACQAALSLYLHLGSSTLLQLESFLWKLLLPLAEGKGGHSIGRQEAALEAILDFCSQPGFVHEVFMNLDCRIERSNLFEAICTLLSKAAFPVSSTLGSVHLLSLEGIYSILAALASRCPEHGLLKSASPPHDKANICAVWNALCFGLPPPLALSSPGLSPSVQGSSAAENGVHQSDGQAVATVALLEKHAKTRLAVAADHFNRDYKKGFQFLQSLGLLGDVLEPEPVARFLRHCPGLSKQTIGDLLGENDQFFLDVLDAFTATFQFRGLAFDMAIRLYLESFRLPGEAQKINRIMESFGKHYHEQCPNLFKNADAVYILGYSVILLNTDQHNVGVKKKMTCEEFIRNNRGINGGADLPHPFLRELYASISQNEIRISADQQASGLVLASPVLWTDLAQQAQSPRGTFFQAQGDLQRVERQMFMLLWGPTIAAVSVILDHAEDTAIARQALDSLLLCARIASCHRLDEVLDSLITSLNKHTSVLNPAMPQASIAFGTDELSCMATETMFELANRYGDNVRAGWKTIMDVVMRLYRLGQLPASVAALEGEDAEAAAMRLPRLATSRSAASAPSLLSRAFLSLISLETNESSSPPELSAREEEALRRTAACLEACRIGELIADSKFLQQESLVELVRAIVHAAGPLQRLSAMPESMENAEMCVELVIAVALRNRDRLLLIWPYVHDFLAAILAPAQGNGKQGATPLVARAALGLLRVCQRLLPYKQETADVLLRSLQLLLRLSPAAAWDLAQPMAAEVLALVSGSAGFIRSMHGWKTVCALIAVTSLHPEAAAVSMKALASVARPSALSHVAFTPVLEAVVSCVERNAKDKAGESAMQAVNMLESMFEWLVQPAKSDAAKMPATPSTAAADGQPAPAMEGMRPKLWAALVSILSKLGTLQMEQLRNQALVILQRGLTASDGLPLSSNDWADALGDAVIPLVGSLAVAVKNRSSFLRGSERSLRLAVGLLTKTFLQNLDRLQDRPQFPHLWNRILQVMYECNSSQSETLAEAVPEAMKNVLLVMATRGVLSPAWTDPEGHSLWDLTWYKAHAISANLTPALLAESGLVAGLPVLPKGAAELESAAGQQPTPREDRAQPPSQSGGEPSLVAPPEGTPQPASAIPSSEPGPRLSGAPQQTTYHSIDPGLEAANRARPSSTPDAQEADAPSLVPSTAQQDPQMKELTLPAADGEHTGQPMQHYTVSLSGMEAAPHREMPAGGGDSKYENSAPGEQPAWQGVAIPGAAAAPGAGDASRQPPQQQPSAPAGHAAAGPDFSQEVLSLDFRQAAPGGALRSSLDIPSSPPTPSSNPFASLVFHKSPGRSAQLPPAPSAHSLDLEPALPRAPPDQDAPPLHLSGPSLAAEPSPAAPSSASQESSAASAPSAAYAAGAAPDSQSTPLRLLPAQRGNQEPSSSQSPSLQEAPDGTDTGQPALKARPPPSVFAGPAPQAGRGESYSEEGTEATPEQPQEDAQVASSGCKQS